MKKIVVFILLLFITINVYAEENLREVKLVKCENAENMFIEENKEYKRIKLIAYDKMDGEFNKEIDEYVCNTLSNASKIEIKNDSSGDKYDKYNRELVWVYVDSKLLQKELIKLGYGEVNHVTNTYEYLDELCSAEKSAIKSRLKVWNYPDVKEAYCKSGIDLSKKAEEKEEVKEEKKRITNEDLIRLIVLSFGILFMMLLYRKKR